LSCDYFNQSCSAKGKIAPVVILPPGLSNHNKVVLWPGCEGCARCNFHKKNVRGARFTAKRRGRCCNLSVDVALKVRFTTSGMCKKSNTQILYMWR